MHIHTYTLVSIINTHMYEDNQPDTISYTTSYMYNIFTYMDNCLTTLYHIRTHTYIDAISYAMVNVQPQATQVMFVCR